ncbi:MAG: AI-2E family transporter [Anaerolineae bacterium]
MPKAMPNPSEASSSLGRRIARVWLLYLRGQLLSALSIAVLTWVVGAGLGLAGALWLGLFAGLMETVPHIGPLVAVVPAIVVALWKGSTVIDVANWQFALIIAAVYVAIQQIGSLIIQPKVLGKELDLPPLVVLVAIVAGTAIGGIAGLLMAIPILVTAREIVAYAIERRKGARAQPHDALNVASTQDKE